MPEVRPLISLRVTRLGVEVFEAACAAACPLRSEAVSGSPLRWQSVRPRGLKRPASTEWCPNENVFKLR